jgi:hypothetical protein
MTQVAFSLFDALGREDEREADYYGVEAMHAAGYDSRMAISFFEKLKAASGGGEEGVVSQLLSTHPATQDRIDTIRAQTQTFQFTGRERVDSSEFQKVKKRATEFIADAPERVTPFGFNLPNSLHKRHIHLITSSRERLEQLEVHLGEIENQLASPTAGGNPRRLADLGREPRGATRDDRRGESARARGGEPRSSARDDTLRE